jgi:hypothetical protein
MNQFVVCNINCFEYGRISLFMSGKTNLPQVSSLLILQGSINAKGKHASEFTVSVFYRE